MIFDQNRQSATKRNRSYDAKQFGYFGQKGRSLDRKLIMGMGLYSMINIRIIKNQVLLLGVGK